MIRVATLTFLALTSAVTQARAAAIEEVYTHGSFETAGVIVKLIRPCRSTSSSAPSWRSRPPGAT